MRLEPGAVHGLAILPALVLALALAFAFRGTLLVATFAR